MKKIILILLIGFNVSSCANPFGNIDTFIASDYGLDFKKNILAPSGLETVSGASYSTTSLGRKISVSTGQALSQIKVSTSKNRVIYLNVQGQIND